MPDRAIGQQNGHGLGYRMVNDRAAVLTCHSDPRHTLIVERAQAGTK
jgi:hypothetical protein